MSENTQDRQQRYKEELKQLEKREAEKRFLYSKNPGGGLDAPAPRPSDDFIQKCVGPLKSQAELRTEAKANIAKQERAEKQERERAYEVRRSMAQHQKRIKQKT